MSGNNKNRSIRTTETLELSDEDFVEEYTGDDPLATYSDYVNSITDINRLRKLVLIKESKIFDIKNQDDSQFFKTILDFTDIAKKNKELEVRVSELDKQLEIKEKDRQLQEKDSQLQEKEGLIQLYVEINNLKISNQNLQKTVLSHQESIANLNEKISSIPYKTLRKEKILSLNYTSDVSKFYLRYILLPLVREMKSFEDIEWDEFEAIYTDYMEVKILSLKMGVNINILHYVNSIRISFVHSIKSLVPSTIQRGVDNMIEYVGYLDKLYQPLTYQLKKTIDVYLQQNPQKTRATTSINTINNNNK
ncbi:hypothetical protein DLAC_01858 [Tieghemostelium lacteum]|uniref:Uncharacterized protein n=1 Tax=Tieghemostelium lacteum TaxID=361077 RepID=A0A152A6U1_TIELA|nr:hypothetical protein DLAC_01858 [Tieghemostelium lacteum]|eukprot:KYR01841.1 hypothetical protein DLAC_01858 [Tieghemostelium lacteum]